MDASLGCGRSNRAVKTSARQQSDYNMYYHLEREELAFNLAQNVRLGGAAEKARGAGIYSYRSVTTE